MSHKFHYKGLSPEDRVFALTPELSAAKAKGTMYEAWFDTMKTSPWYQQIAITGVFPSREAERAWGYFGDLREIDFEPWWISKGYAVFAERIDYRPISIAGTRTQLRRAGIAKHPPSLLIEVPLNLHPSVLRQQFEEILEKHSEYAADADRWDYSTAELHQQRETKLDFKTIKKWLSIFQRYEVASKAPGFKLYNFASELRLHPLFNRKEFRERDVPPDLRVKMANVASDILKSAKSLMANATELRFPDTTAHPWASSGTRTRR